MRKDINLPELFEGGSLKQVHGSAYSVGDILEQAPFYGLEGMALNIRITRSVDISEENVDAVKEFLAEEIENNVQRVVFYGDGSDRFVFWGLLEDETLLSFELSSEPRSLTIRTYGDQRDRQHALVARYVNRIEAIEEVSGKDVDVQFSHLSTGTVESVETNRTIVECPSFSSIRNNYPNNREALASLHDGMDLERGRLLIWHGPPGTGKTFALRSLVRAHRDRFTPVYVTDIDEFTTNITYYNKLIGQMDGPVLFLLEDASRYVLKESRIEAGAAMSHLLNLTDGMLSRGRNDLFVLTFNREIQEIDPAIRRPGRCHSILEFEPFTAEEAKAWLREHDRDEDLNDRDYTLAELYRHIREGDPELTTEFAPENGEVGFRK